MHDFVENQIWQLSEDALTNFDTYFHVFFYYIVIVPSTGLKCFLTFTVYLMEEADLNPIRC